jgi:hypothetical protein
MNTTSQFLLGEQGKELLNTIKDISLRDLILLINLKLCRVDIETYEEIILFKDYLIDLNKVVSLFFDKEVPKCYSNESIKEFFNKITETSFNSNSSKTLSNIKKLQEKREEVMRETFDITYIETLIKK